MRTIITLVSFCLIAAAQSGDVTISPLPPRIQAVTVLDYDGSGNLIYRGTAQTPTTYASTLQRATCASSHCQTFTNIVVLTNTGTVTATSHGLLVGNEVTISGATVDTDLNGTYYVQTVADANTFTITTASVADATYTESTLVISTRAPKTNDPLWTIQKISYTTVGASDLVSRIQSSSGNQIWANRATTTGASKITYR